MATFTVRPEGIIRQPALTMPGNATGAEAACTSLTASQIRTLLSLGTTSDVTFDIVRATTSVQTPLVNNASAALTLGNSTYGVTVPGALTTSKPIEISGAPVSAVIGDFINTSADNVYLRARGPLKSYSFGTEPSNWFIYDNTLSAYVVKATTTGITSIGGVVWLAGTTSSFPSIRRSSTTAAFRLGDDSADAPISCAGITASGDISANKLTITNTSLPYTSVQHWSTSYLDRVVTGVGLVREADIQTYRNIGGTFGTDHRVYGTSSTYDSGGTKYTRLTHDGTNGILSTSSGSMRITSAASEVFIYGASGALMTYGNGVDVYTGVSGSQFGRLQAGNIRAFGSGTSQYTNTSHTGTNGEISTSSGNLNLVPGGGTVAVTGGITASGNVSAASLVMAGATIVSYSVTTAILGGASWNTVNLNASGQTALSATSSLITTNVPINIAYTGTFLQVAGVDSASWTTNELRLGGISGGSYWSTVKLYAGGSAALTLTSTSTGVNGNLSYAQGLSTGTVTKSANYTTTADDYCVNVTANSIDITFETAVGCANREHEVINSGSGVVTLKTTSAQTISGSASGALTLAQWKSIRVKSDGANWLIMSQIT